jgi:hypothetical protein
MNGKLNKFETSVYSDYALNDFILDGSNQDAYNCAVEWTNKVISGQTRHVHIYGPCGNGKTHLASGVINLILKNHPEVAAYACNIERLFLKKDEIPNNSILFCEGSWSLFDQIYKQIIDEATQRKTALIFTTDKSLPSYKELNSVEIRMPSVTLLQKIVDDRLKCQPDIKVSPIIEGSVRAALHFVRKELLKKELSTTK